MADKREENLVWIDMEMSGLNPAQDVILEVAVLVTNNELEIIGEGPSLVIHQDLTLLEGMDDWNLQHHKASGLWDRVLQSSSTIDSAEQEILEFLSGFSGPKRSPLCGNSIAQDRAFMSQYMPKLSDFLHYRMIDVSTIKELVKRWYPDGPKPPVKNSSHRALEDIKESIEELKFYRANYFR